MTTAMIRPLEVKKFLELIIEMRSAQKNYFRTRDRQVMLEAKKLEAKVDQQVVDLLVGIVEK